VTWRRVEERKRKKKRKRKRENDAGSLAVLLTPDP
jgi:hypothetical protein